MSDEVEPRYEALRWMWTAYEDYNPTVSRLRLTATDKALDNIEAHGYRITTDIDGYINDVRDLTVEQPPPRKPAPPVRLTFNRADKTWERVS